MSVSETPDFSTGVAGSDQVDPTLDVPLVLGTHELKGRLVVGTGKYATYELMQECLEASGAEVITVAVRRERLVDADGRNILDFHDLARYTILPNPAYTPGFARGQHFLKYIILLSKEPQNALHVNENTYLHRIHNLYMLPNT